MANVTLEGFDELIRSLEGFTNNLDSIADEALNEAAPILEGSFRSKVASVTNRVDPKGRPYSTGALAGSIQATPAKKNGLGHFIAVRPTGSDARGMGNSQKMSWLENGTSKQAARPVRQAAVSAVEDQCVEVCKGVIEKYLNEIGV